MRGYEEHGMLLVPGRLRGFRAWRYDAVNNRLMSLHYQLGPSWLTHGVQVAKCPIDPSSGVECDCDDCIDDLDLAVDLHDGDFEKNYPPAPNCTCGFYATYEPGNYKSPLPRRWERWVDLPGQVVHGTILASGKVLLGDIGFRAQKAEVEGLYGWGARKVAQRLGLPWLHTKAKYIKRYPPDGLMHLENSNVD